MPRLPLFVGLIATSLFTTGAALADMLGEGPHVYPRRVRGLPATTGSHPTDWQVIEGGIAGEPFSPCVDSLIFDAAQLDPQTGNAIGGDCFGGPAARFIETPYVATSIVIEDFRVTPAPGLQIGGGAVLVYWDPPAPRPLYLVVYFYDNFSFDCTLEPCPMFGAPWPADNLMWGAIFDFGYLPPSEGYYTLHFDFCLLPEHAAPADGVGAITLLIASDVAVNDEPPFIGYVPAMHAAEVGLDPQRPSPMFLQWGFRDDGQPGNGLARPGQPDVINLPDERRAWTNNQNAAALPPAIWSGDECRILPAFPAEACQFVTVETAFSLWSTLGDLGACCLPEQGCRLRTEEDCIAGGGIFHGVEKSCDDVDCLGCSALLRGDTNCDGIVNNFDIDCFTLILIGGQGCNPECPGVCVGDTNCDGVVNMFDIDPFIGCLIFGCGPC